MALLPRKQWTDPLAWAVWKQRQNNKLRHAGLSPYPDGEFPTIQTLNYKEPIGSSTAKMRYLWHQDGQDDFLLLGNDDFGFTTTAKLEASYIPSGTSGFQMILGRTSSDRFYIGTNGTDLQIGSGSLTVLLVPLDIGEENHTVIEYTGTNIVVTHNSVEVYNEITDFSGTLDNVGVTATAAMTNFFEGALTALIIETDSNTYPYKLTGNGPIALQVGTKLGDELVQNGSFGFGGDGWGGNSAPIVTYGAGFLDYNGDTNDGINQSVSVQTGQYLIHMELANIVANGTPRVQFNVPSIYVELTSTDGRNFYAVVPSDSSATTMFVELGGFGSGGEYRVLSVSAKQLPASALTRENGEPGGSDIEKITRKADNSGFTGDGANVYDFAPGAND